VPIGGILISVQAKLQPWVDETTKHQRQGIEEACKTFSTWKIISSSFELILRIHYETGWLATIVETSVACSIKMLQSLFMTIMTVAFTMNLL